LLLTVIEQRLDLFSALGVEAALVLTFSEELCRLTPFEYVEQVLVESMGAKSISVGHNHHFGRDREGNAQLLQQFGQKRDFVVHVAPMVFVENLEVSSSRIRELIQNKDLELANQLLSRPFALRGEVVEGAKRGRVLGFPTANLLAAFNQLVPPTGVYAGSVKIGGATGFEPAVINIGYRPTFAGGKGSNEAEKAATIEAHLLDYQGDLYGQVIEIAFLKFLRDEKKFDGLEALTNQIAQDCQVARCYLKECLADA
jgi:riboflavin kinase/FMN adenylyltransferase